MDIIKQKLMEKLDEKIKLSKGDTFRLNTDSVYFTINSKNNTFKISSNESVTYHITHLALFVDLIRNFNEDSLLDFVVVNKNTILID